MTKNTEKPTPEAKALSLFLMAFKKTNSAYKENAKSINRLWDMVMADEISKEEYLEAVQTMLESYGGYAEVVEKTVQHYINTTGEWKLKGDDQYCQDAQEFADKIMKLR
ncbi:MAG: hypothetical protein PHQ74_01465 [Crocinitomicaceae bacterium]|nr:hypothetical protein [Crocinitomicaceae bacterium]